MVTTPLLSSEVIDLSPQIGLDPTLNLVLDRVRLRAQRRATWLRKLWQEEGEPGGQMAVTHAEIETHLRDRDSPEAEAEWLATDETVTPLNQALAEVENALESEEDSRLALFRGLFSLGPEDSDLFQACLAVALDPSLARVYAYLQDHAGRGYVTETLVARLFGYGRCFPWSAESPLRRWSLVTETEVGAGEPAVLACDPMIRNWLLGEEELDQTLLGLAQLRFPQPSLESWKILEQEAIAFLERLFAEDDPQRVRVSIVGLPGSGRRTLAANICEALGLLLLSLETDTLEAADWRRVFWRSQRQAYLSGCALAWGGDSLTQRPWPQDLPNFPIQFAIGEPEMHLPPVQGLVDYRLEMPLLSLQERRKLWQTHIPASRNWPADKLDALVARHQVTVREIVALANSQVKGATEAIDWVRSRSRHRLGELAQLLECSFVQKDLVVSDSLEDALEDFKFEAKQRVAFWERSEAQRLFPQGRGLLALFSGPPGTGKTMAAQVIAKELNLDLFRIDLSTVVSKYVGDTSKNLERILSRAIQMDVVLLFDEADALFGKRTEVRDAHDRFANTDTGYLLQAIESYQGVAVLATNKKSNIDPAFIRRLRYVLEFPKPYAAQRLKIWQQLVGELAGEARLQALEQNLEDLAEGLEVTGAQIKFAILAAIFAAQRDGKPLGMTHLLRGLERELMKEGRALSSRERERWMSHG